MTYKSILRIPVNQEKLTKKKKKKNKNIKKVKKKKKSLCD